MFHLFRVDIRHNLASWAVIFVLVDFSVAENRRGYERNSIKTDWKIRLAIRVTVEKEDTSKTIISDRFPCIIRNSTQGPLSWFDTTITSGGMMDLMGKTLLF